MEIIIYNSGVWLVICFLFEIFSFSEKQTWSGRNVNRYSLSAKLFDTWNKKT